MNYRKHSYGNATQAPCKTCGANAYEACKRDPAVPLDIKAIDITLTKPEAWVILRALAAYSEDKATCTWLADRISLRMKGAGWVAATTGEVTTNEAPR